jgi:hypothetical protein
MSKQPLTPTRKALLQVYIACLKRAENRIIRAHHTVAGAPYAHDYKPATGIRFRHICESLRAHGMEGHATALLHLRIKRSQFTAELEGLEWH